MQDIDAGVKLESLVGACVPHVSFQKDWSVWHWKYISITGELVSRSVCFFRPQVYVVPCEDHLGIGPPWQTLEPWLETAVVKSPISRKTRFLEEILRSRCPAQRGRVVKFIRSMAERPRRSRMHSTCTVGLRRSLGLLGG